MFHRTGEELLFLNPKNMALRYFVSSATTHAQSHTPEDINLQQHCCHNLRPRYFFVGFHLVIKHYNIQRVPKKGIYILHRYLLKCVYILHRYLLKCVYIFLAPSVFTDNAIKSITSNCNLLFQARNILGLNMGNR